jgi:hypothetical protein
VIVKSMSRKSPTFGQVLAYINRPSAKGRPILHNLVNDADDLRAVEHEYLDNFRYLRERKNGNALYHEILSFGEDDGPHLDDDVIEELVRRYLELRAPNALAYARSHGDRACVHVHLLISANDVASHRRLRLGKGHFERVKRAIEAHQRARHPELASSKVDHWGSRGQKPKQAPGVQRASRRDLVAAAVGEQLERARSVESFLMRLRILGLDVYVRGRHTGVAERGSGRRHRFSTLGLDRMLSERLGEWARVEARRKKLDGAEREWMRREILATGSREAVAVALTGGPPVEGPEERARMRRVADALRARGALGQSRTLGP